MVWFFQLLLKYLHTHHFNFKLCQPERLSHKLKFSFGYISLTLKNNRILTNGLLKSQMHICKSKLVLFRMLMLDLCANVWPYTSLSLQHIFIYLTAYIRIFVCVHTTHRHTHILPVFLSMSIMKLLAINEKAFNYTLKLFLDVIINHYLKIIPLHMYFNMHLCVYVHVCILIFLLSLRDTNKLLRIIGISQRRAVLFFVTIFPKDSSVTSIGTNLKLHGPLLMDWVRQCIIV